MLDTRTYEIEFPDGRSDGYTANVIAEKIYPQCDAEERQYNLMEGLIDHKTDGHAIDRADMYIKHGRNNQVRKTTNAWNLCVEWKYGTTSWECSCLTSRKATLPRLLSMQLPISYLMPLLLCGGLHMYSRSAA
jgi:hypothetical protein